MSTPATADRHCALPDSPLAAEQAGLDACVHCGFCLQACPTYLTLEDENDSPRGRIVLMRAMLDGDLPPASPSIETHIARCLGCRACETACPSGVPYGHLLEATRETLAQRRPIPFVARLILFVFARPTLLRAAMAGGRVVRALGIARLLARLPGRAGFGMAMLASTVRPRNSRPRSAAENAESTNGSESAAKAELRGTVAVLEGCVMEGLFAPANRATEHALAANGFQRCAAPGQRCCGALHAHAGDADTARRLARANIAAFERANAEYICVNAAGCGAMMKDYGHLLARDPAWADRARAVSAKVRDISELLSQPANRPGRARETLRVAYDAPCHLLHAQRIANPPLALLRAIPGVELVPLNESDLCCGSAGIYNLVEPETSNVVLDRKLANIMASAADVIATGNPGCMMQIGAGLLRAGSGVRAVHPVELLDATYVNR